MPTYEYACKDCSEHLEVVQSFKDDALTECPSCGGNLRKVFSAAGIIFKGSGWHVKDYATSSNRAGGREGGSNEGDSSKDGSGSKETTSADAGSSSKGSDGAGKDGGGKSAGGKGSGSEGSTGAASGGQKQTAPSSRASGRPAEKKSA